MKVIKLRVLCDASYKHDKHIAGISMVIKYSNSKNGKLKDLLKYNEIIAAKSSTESEVLAIYKAVKYISESQHNQALPKKSYILIYSDNRSVIHCLNKSKFIKGIDINIMSFLLDELSVLSKRNSLQILWISRKENREAHGFSRALLKEIDVVSSDNIIKKQLLPVFYNK